MHIASDIFANSQRLHGLLDDRDRYELLKSQKCVVLRSQLERDCVYVCLCLCLHACVLACLHVCGRVCMCAWTCACLHVCVCTCVHPQGL